MSFDKIVEYGQVVIPAAVVVLGTVAGVAHRFGREVPGLTKVIDGLAFLGGLIVASDKRKARKARRK